MLNARLQSRALTVDERAVNYDAVVLSRTRPADREKRLARWREHRAMSAEVLAARLGDIGADEDTLAALLAAESDAPALSWTPALNAALTERFEPASDQGQQVLGVLYQHASDDLRTRLAAVADTHNGLPFSKDIHSLVAMMVERLHKRIALATSRAITLEINIARILGNLEGETPEARFASFVDRASVPAFAAEFFDTYPVLARIVSTAIRQSNEAAAEFVDRLACDWDIVRDLIGEGSPGQLKAYEAGQGDPHKDGRSVVIATFESGTRIVYKPRSLEPEIAFAKATDWLNGKGFAPAILPLVSADRGEYGWQRFIEAAPCPPAEVADFYRRQGGLLAVLYAFGGSDFHFENVLASGAHPHLVDLATVLHPRIPLSPETYSSMSAARRALRRSVTGVGMLPNKMSLGFGAAADLSGLGASGEQEVPFSTQVPEKAGTDEVRYVPRRNRLHEGAHRPVVDGAPVDADRYSADVVQGFQDAYRILLANREEVLGPVLAAFEGVPLRAILRPTWFYTCLLSDTCHPDNARDGVDREYLYENLWLGVAAKPELARAIRYEKQDLVNCDVPYFWAPADSTSIFTSRGEEINGFFDVSALDDARVRVSALSTEDLERQTWIIRSSFQTPDARLENPAFGQDRPSEIALAVSLGDRLADLAVEDERGASWIGLSLAGGKHWEVAAQGVDLYAGTAGIALFLSYLSELAGEPRFRRLAERAAESLVTAQPSVGSRCGLFEGWAGLTYVLAHLGALWGRSDLLDAAERHVRVGAEAVESDTVFDVIGGAAGAIAGVTALHTVRPTSTTLEAVRSYADHLVRSAAPQSVGVGWLGVARRALAGISHGNAGIALALLRAGDITGEHSYATTAAAALDFEDTLFDPGRGNWVDARESDIDVPLSEIPDMVAWCHGAPGIGLARLAGLEISRDSDMRSRSLRDVGRAVRATTTHGPYGNVCACHGDLGNADFLLSAARVTGDVLATKAVGERLKDVVQASRLPSGVTGGLETPGFMTGTAGFGYQLLRAAAPERIPSVLALQPPAQGA